jgi:hypothetical protein
VPVSRATEVDDSSRVAADGMATQRSPRDERLYVSIVISLLVATTAISLYDMYLLLSLMAP